MNDSIIKTRILALSADITERLNRIKSITGSAKFNIYDVLEVEKLAKAMNEMINLRIVLSEFLYDGLQVKNWDKEEKKNYLSPHAFQDNKVQYF